MTAPAGNGHSNGRAQDLIATIPELAPMVERLNAAIDTDEATVYKREHLAGVLLMIVANRSLAERGLEAEPG